jgi:hypothetical protein
MLQTTSGIASNLLIYLGFLSTFGQLLRPDANLSLAIYLLVAVQVALMFCARDRELNFFILAVTFASHARASGCAHSHFVRRLHAVRCGSRSASFTSVSDLWIVGCSRIPRGSFYLAHSPICLDSSTTCPLVHAATLSHTQRFCQWADLHVSTCSACEQITAAKAHTC